MYVTSVNFCLINIYSTTALNIRHIEFHAAVPQISQHLLPVHFFYQNRVDKGCSATLMRRIRIVYYTIHAGMYRQIRLQAKEFDTQQLHVTVIEIAHFVLI